MKTLILYKNKSNSFTAFSHAFEKIKDHGRSVTKITLKKLKNFYNSLGGHYDDSVCTRTPESVREEIYSKYFSYFERGL